MKEEVERGSGSAGLSESASSEATSREARPKAEPTAIEQEPTDTRDMNDPARLADEARALIEKQAADLRGANVPIETEPPTVYRP